jgi:hypothetical protein
MSCLGLLAFLLFPISVWVLGRGFHTWLLRPRRPFLNEPGLAFDLGYLAAQYDDTREWAVERGGEWAGRGWDAYWDEVGGPL